MKSTCKVKRPRGKEIQRHGRTTRSPYERADRKVVKYAREKKKEASLRFFPPKETGTGIIPFKKQSGRVEWGEFLGGRDKKKKLLKGLEVRPGRI